MEPPEGASKLVGRALLLQAPDALPQNPSDSAFRAASSPFRGAYGFCSAASDYEQRSFG